jgi:hypothetical protein
MTEKLNITRVFNEIWELYKTNVGILITLAIAIYLGAAILIGLFFIVAPILVLLAAVVIFVAQFWYQGMVIKLVERLHGGGPRPTVGELFGEVAPRLGALIGAGLLAGIAILVGLILLIVPGLYLITIWAALAPLIVIERAAVFDAFRGSQALVKGNGWQVFGTLAIIWVLQGAFTGALQNIFGTDSFVGGLVGTLIPSLLLAPIGALAVAVIYFELTRIRASGGAPGGVATATPGGGAAPPPRPRN